MPPDHAVQPAVVSNATRALTAALLLFACAEPEPSAMIDLQGRPTDPLAAPHAVATVLLFTRSDCPLSNRYAPQVQQLAERLAPRGVAFLLVYVDPEESADSIRAHMATYSLDLPVVRDIEHDLVRRIGARVTPEAAVFDAHGQLAYLGRIDDRWSSLQRRRREARQHDLADAVQAVLAGEVPPQPRTKAVGCIIEDLR